VKGKDLRDLSDEELGAKVRELRDELFGARVKHATGQLENTAKLRTLRRDVARVETILAQRRGAAR
jgi:large subunit ribosomal protein L29